MKREAFCEDGWRWWLSRRWAPGPGFVWCMLNPSYADGQTDDPTMHQVMYYSREAGGACCWVVNLYGFVSSDPEALWKIPDPVGYRNDRSISRVLEFASTERAPRVVCAWGAPRIPLAWRGFHRERVQHVLGLFEARGAELLVLGLTRSGAPMHPARKPRSLQLRAWEGAACTSP